MSEVVKLGPEDAPEVVSSLCDAFYDYPVMRYVVGPASDYDDRLRVLIKMFVMARVYRGEVMIGVGEPDDLDAAAVVSFPGRTESKPEFAELRKQTWKLLGADAEARYDAFGNACEEFDIAEPHTHLNMIGVRSSAQGRGLGRILLEQVHEICDEDDESTGVSLTTEVVSNVPFYEHFGYRVIGRAEVSPELTSWSFFRKKAQPE